MVLTNLGRPLAAVGSIYCSVMSVSVNEQAAPEYRSQDGIR